MHESLSRRLSIDSRSEVFDDNDAGRPPPGENVATVKVSSKWALHQVARRAVTP
jgi:hypothetical protein